MTRTGFKGNGLGPWWFPARARRWLTDKSRRYFVEADWDRHDAGYERGFPARSVCDFRFLRAMLHDSSRAETVRALFVGLFLSLLFYTLVRLFGWASYHRGIRRG